MQPCRSLWLIVAVGSFAFQTVHAFTCEYCPPDTFCYRDLSTSCPTHSSSPAGSSNISDCTCNAGFYPLYGACVECLPDHWCPGQGQMFSCIEHSSAASGSTAGFHCVCNAGYEGAGNTTCTECASGTYKTTAVLSCIDCPVNTYPFDPDRVN